MGDLRVRLKDKTEVVGMRNAGAKGIKVENVYLLLPSGKSDFINGQVLEAIGGKVR